MPDMRARALIAGLAVAVLAAGCGGVHRRNASAIGPVGVPASFSEDLNSVCLASPSSQGTTIRAYSQGESVTSFEQYLRRFRALTPSPTEQAAYSKFVAGFDQALRDFKAGKPGSAVLAAENGEAFAAQLGAPACERVISTGGY